MVYLISKFSTNNNIPVVNKNDIKIVMCSKSSKNRDAEMIWYDPGLNIRYINKCYYYSKSEVIRAKSEY